MWRGQSMRRGQSIARVDVKLGELTSVVTREFWALGKVSHETHIKPPEQFENHLKHSDLGIFFFWKLIMGTGEMITFFIL